MNYIFINKSLLEIRSGGRKWNISFYDYSSNMAGGGSVGVDYGECDYANYTVVGRVLNLQ